MATKIITPKKNLKDFRKKHYTQDVFSEMVFMDQAQYNRRENGKMPITDEEWERFAKALNVDIEEIKEDDAPIVNITHNHGENDHSINGYEITIKIPKNMFDGFHEKLDTLINLLGTNKKEK